MKIAICDDDEKDVNTLKTILVSLCPHDEIIVCSQTFEDVKEKFSDRFLWVSRGILVNFDFIEKIGRKSCTLRDGRTILLSRGRQAEITEAYDNWLFERLEGKR